MPHAVLLILKVIYGIAAVIFGFNFFQIEKGDEVTHDPLMPLFVGTIFLLVGYLLFFGA